MIPSHKSRTRKRVVHMGCKRSGKSTNAQSIQQTIAKRRFPGQIIKTNAVYVQQERQLALHQCVAPSESVEAITILVGELEIEWEFWPGEMSMLDDAVDAREIASRLDEQGVDLLVVALNPLMHDQDLAEYAFIELMWLIQEKTDFSLGKSMQIAAELLWDLPQDKLENLNADLGEITDEQYREGRINRQADAKFGLALTSCFSIEGCDDGDKALDILTRTARTTGADLLELLNLQAIAACRPGETVVVGTHADLLQFLPGIGEMEFLRCCRHAFPDPTEVSVGQVLPQASLDIEIRSNLEKPVWIKGPSAGAEHLLTSVVNLLNRTRRSITLDSRQSYTGSLVAVALAALPVAVLVSAWAILPLISIGFWTLCKLQVFSPPSRPVQRVPKTQKISQQNESSTSQPSELADPSTPRNRVTDQMPSRNGVGSHA